MLLCAKSPRMSSIFARQQNPPLYGIATTQHFIYRIDPLIIKLAHFGCSRTKMKSEDTITIYPSFCGEKWQFFDQIYPWVWYQRVQHARGLQRWDTDETSSCGRHLSTWSRFCFHHVRREALAYGEEMKMREERMKNVKPMLEIIRKQLIDEYGDGSFELINRMLDLNPEKRPTIEAVLKNNIFSRPIIRDWKVYLYKKSLCRNELMTLIWYKFTKRKGAGKTLQL